MDYLDPKKQARQRFILFLGYILIAVAVVTSTVILVNQAYGFNLSRNGTVIQNGLAFFSSHPSVAKIYINGNLNSATTDSSLYLPEAVYNISLERSGYYNWQREIELDGGSVQHYDYPFLFPKTLTTTPLQAYSSAPTLFTQSPDRHWLMVGKPGNTLTSFDLYDLKNPSKTPTLVSLRDGLLTKTTTSESWKIGEWADDNQHVLLEHDFGAKKEFILVDRASPDQSVNLSNSLTVNPTKLQLINKKYDQYYIYDSSTKSLQSTSLTSPALTSVLDHVLAYQSYGNNTVLYVSDSNAANSKIWLKLLSGGKSYNLHTLPASSSYVLDLTQYSGTMYVAAGASSADKVYIYNDPLSQLSQSPNQSVTPIQVLHVNQPNYLSFSDNAQFIVTENGSQFGVYDIQNQKGYNFKSTAPDSPTLHAEWMDGDRLDYVSGGKLIVFDYDHTNQHVLESASSQFTVKFAPDYKYVYSLGQNSSGLYFLNQTWLLAPVDR